MYYKFVNVKKLDKLESDEVISKNCHLQLKDFLIEHYFILSSERFKCHHINKIQVQSISWLSPSKVPWGNMMGTMKTKDTQNTTRKKVFMKKQKRLKPKKEISSKLLVFISNPFSMEKRKILRSKISPHLSIN